VGKDDEAVAGLVGPEGRHQPIQELSAEERPVAHELRLPELEVHLAAELVRGQLKKENWKSMHLEEADPGADERALSATEGRS
jgi:hypothetical protein